MKQENLTSSDDFPSHQEFPGAPYGHGHDLKKWVKALKLPAFSAVMPSRNSHKIQEKLKYGQSIHVNEQKLLTDFAQYIKKDFPLEFPQS